MLIEHELLEPEYFAHIKLTNSENIIGGVTISEDESGIYVHDPLLVKQVSVVVDNIVCQKYMLSPWVVHSKDTVFFIDGYNIITHGELNSTIFDEYVKYINSDSYNMFYNEFLDDTEDPISEITKETLDEAKNKLQKLYDQSFPEA